MISPRVKGRGFARRVQASDDIMQFLLHNDRLGQLVHLLAEDHAPGSCFRLQRSPHLISGNRRRIINTPINLVAF